MYFVYMGMYQGLTSMSEIIERLSNVSRGFVPLDLLPENDIMPPVMKIETTKLRN